MVSSEQRSNEQRGFNLAIEVLLISRLYQLHLAKLSLASCFHLAIEILLISSDNDEFIDLFRERLKQYQFRNRGSRNFEC